MPIDPGRRRLLKTLVASAAALPFASCLALAGDVQVPTDQALFPQGVASGDPRPDRVLLWTRAPAASGDVRVRLQVALDPGFTQLLVERDLLARAGADHCLRVRIEGLAAGSDYHYRFLRKTAGGWRSSRHGRTRTAPAADSTAPVRFGVACCQHFEGRWYNSLHALLADPPDFLLHLGDAIYEYAGDPAASGERHIAFDDAAGAISDGAHGNPCARSLDNYRQLHRIYRSDALWQRLLATVPLVAIWDDHEFANDCWQDVATYGNGLRDERDTQRRRNAEQAYFEFMPVDIDVGATGADGAQAVDAGLLFPQTRLWRELRFGRDAHLFLTDYRSARPDHPIPEDAFPGGLAYDEAALREWLPKAVIDFGTVSKLLLPYVDQSHPLWPKWRKPLQRALNRGYRDAGLDKRAAARRVRDILAAPIALMVLRKLLERYNDAVPGFMHAPLPGRDESGLPLGLPWVAMGKTGLFAELGCRYFVVKDSYDLLAALRDAQGEAPALGQAQAAWLRERLAASDARWKIVASSVAMVPMVVDLARPDLEAPPLYRRRFYLNVDQWDGFPRQRRALLDTFDAAGGVVLLSGDIHAGFAAQHTPRTVEFTLPAVSSTTLHEMSSNSAAADADNAEAGKRMVAALESLLLEGDPGLRYVQSRRHGVGTARVDAGAFAFEVTELPATLCRTCHYEDGAAVLAQASVRRFAVDAATHTLEDG
ncbi:MAG: alkaline phosphatase D family protein [Thermomonas sp.]|nr:alkaline phosphatase D family protein [Thermomonas sp.]